MPAKLTTSEFIDRAVAVHGLQYGYACTVYRGNSYPVTITCQIHGEFQQKPSNHLSGGGCSACAGSSRVKALSSYWEKNPTIKVEVIGPPKPPVNHIRSVLAAERFITEAKSVHGDAYDYTEVRYKRSNSKVLITCGSHGQFTQTPNSHLNGSGCPACAVERGSIARSALAKKEFIPRSKDVHANKYDYSLACYVNNYTPVEIICNRHGSFFQAPSDHIAGHACPSCSPRGASHGQRSVLSYIQSLGFEAKLDQKIPGSLLELDISVIGTPVAIEYDGDFWHSEKYRSNDYHSKKQYLSALAGVDLIQIYASEWRLKRKQCESVIRTRLGVSPSIFARNCEVVRVGSADCSTFFDEYHIQGRSNRGVGYGLAHEGKLVSVMSFSLSMSARGVAHDKHSYELIRFASSTVVTGGGSRLLKAFLRDHPECKKVVSYSDNRLFKGGLYSKLGFNLDRHIPPDYKYTMPNYSGVPLPKKLFSHALMPKTLGTGYDPSKTEHENALANGYLRVYDSGKKRWVLDL